MLLFKENFDDVCYTCYVYDVPMEGRVSQADTARTLLKLDLHGTSSSNHIEGVRLCHGGFLEAFCECYDSKSATDETAFAVWDLKPKVSSTSASVATHVKPAQVHLFGTEGVIPHQGTGKYEIYQLSNENPSKVRTIILEHLIDVVLLFALL